MLSDKVFKALSDANRRKIISLLRKKDMTAGDIAKHFNISKPSISEHLKILKNADLISSEKNGQFITYFLNSSVLEDVISYFMEISSPVVPTGKKVPSRR
jgi:DNA-binding transcriptional ArsR family regulator